MAKLNHATLWNIAFIAMIVIVVMYTAFTTHEAVSKIRLRCPRKLHKLPLVPLSAVVGGNAYYIGNFTVVGKIGKINDTTYIYYNGKTYCILLRLSGNPYIVVTSRIRPVSVKWFNATCGTVVLPYNVSNTSIPGWAREVVCSHISGHVDDLTALAAGELPARYAKLCR